MRLGTGLAAIAALGLGWCPPLAAEPVHIELNGLTLNGELTEAGDGPIVLIVHGTLAHNHMELIESLQALLAEREIRSLAITLSLGLDDRRGMYDCTQRHGHHHADAIPEIGAWLDWLAAQDHDQVVLMGHSRGGNQVAWTMTEADRPAVVGAVLLAPMTWDAAKADAAYDAASATPLATLLARAQTGEQLEAVRFLHCEGATASADSFLSYHAADSRFDTPGLLPKIEKPVLVIAASEDAVVADLAGRLSGIDQANVTTLTVEGADHFFLDLYAEEVADAVAEFTAGLP